MGIVDVEIGGNAIHWAGQQQLLRGKAGIGVLGRGAGHGHRAIRAGIERGIGKIGGADAGRAVAGKDPKADMLAL